jgi:chaperone required for assembly of F1-ATPase
MPSEGRTTTSPQLLTAPSQLSAETEDPRGSCHQKETAVELQTVALALDGSQVKTPNLLGF